MGHILSYIYYRIFTILHCRTGSAGGSAASESALRADRLSFSAVVQTQTPWSHEAGLVIQTQKTLDRAQTEQS